MFNELNSTELYETNGGVLATIGIIVGIAAGLAGIGGGIYALGNAKGQNDAHEENNKNSESPSYTLQSPNSNNNFYYA